MTPDEIITAANARISQQEHEIARLKGNVKSLATALNDVGSLFEAQTKGRYQATQEVECLRGQVSFLERYIAFIDEKYSAITREATAHFQHQLAAANWSTYQWSQDAASYSLATRALQEKLAAKSKEENASEKEIQEMLDKYTAMQATVLKTEMEKENAERDLQETERQLAKANKATQDLMRDHEEVTSKLLSQNKFLDAQKRKKTREAAQAREQVTRERNVAEQQLKETEEMIKKSRKLEKRLAEKVKKQEKLRHECDTIFNEAKAIRQSRLLQIKRRKAIQAYTESQGSSGKLGIGREDECLHQGRRRFKHGTETRLKELSLAKAKEQDKLLAQVRGASSRRTAEVVKLLDGSKHRVEKYIFDKVWDLLKNIDSQEKREIAFKTIVTFLGLVLEDVDAIIQDGGEIKVLIAELTELFSEAATPSTERFAKAFIEFSQQSVEGLQPEDKQKATE
ncbi:hypothetical protein MAC_09764 [Metarhizium acridum CQMa 102]|uniref:Uncharacterized protein n=1 Tax=Metarhizium acridum (strain CQMa 102) TaxID=655827 RepID=E9EIR6_METAQ|nr:uncharacterized protein MAC_09764 [Metarhizium acridum CQMa 102]EFY84192.1 hypothetical protein MAC_09764 [Metarhizium acridum CQMa 102]